MNFAEEYIYRFRAQIPWKDPKIVRYTWILHHEERFVRDLELWLCERNKQLEPMRLKIKAYDVSSHAYSTLQLGWTLDLLVHADEQMRYVFMSTDSYSDVLITFICKDFTFCLEEAAYDEL